MRNSTKYPPLIGYSPTNHSRRWEGSPSMTTIPPQSAALPVLFTRVYTYELFRKVFLLERCRQAVTIGEIPFSRFTSHSRSNVRYFCGLLLPSSAHKTTTIPVVKLYGSVGRTKTLEFLRSRSSSRAVTVLRSANVITSDNSCVNSRRL